MVRLITLADSVSAWFGKAIAWLILVMTFAMSYEVIVRYLFNAPTAWSLDVSFIMYGALFMMGGAYTLSRGGHVRGDFIYRLWQRSEEHTSELQSLMRISYAVFCLKKKNKQRTHTTDDS